MHGSMRSHGPVWWRSEARSVGPEPMGPGRPQELVRTRRPAMRRWTVRTAGSVGAEGEGRARGAGPRRRLTAEMTRRSRGPAVTRGIWHTWSAGTQSVEGWAAGTKRRAHGPATRRSPAGHWTTVGAARR